MEELKEEIEKKEFYKEESLKYYQLSQKLEQENEELKSEQRNILRRKNEFIEQLEKLIGNEKYDKAFEYLKMERDFI